MFPEIRGSVNLGPRSQPLQEGTRVIMSARGLKRCEFFSAATLRERCIDEKLSTECLPGRLAFKRVGMPPAQINGRSQNLATDGRFTRLRALLFGSFGINLRSSAQLATDSYSEGAYVTVMSN